MKLEQWLHDFWNARDLLFSCMQVAEQSKAILTNDDMLRTIVHMRHLVLWLGSCLLLLKGEMEDTLETCMRLQRGGRQYLQALPVEFSGWGASDIEALSSSPLLDPATGVMSKILEVTRKDRASGCGGGGGVREHIPDRTASRCAITPSFAKVSSHCKCSFWATGLAAFDCYFSSFVLSIHVGLCRTATSS